jgi:hypothetical protein
MHLEQYIQDDPGWVANSTSNHVVQAARFSEFPRV